MKIKQLFLGSAVALMALTACNKNGANSSVPTPEVGATAGVLRIEISSANGGLRAAEGPNAASGAGIAGTTGEQGVTMVSTYVFSDAGVFVDSKDYTTKGSQALTDAGTLDEAAAAGKFLVDATKKEVLVLPFKTTAKQNVDNVLFVVVNKPSFFPTSFTNVSEFTDAVNHALAIQKDAEYAKGMAEMTAANKFMMVGKCPKFHLTAGKTYDDVKGDFSATNAGKNQFLLTVNRVVSKLVVDFSENPVGKTFGGTSEGAGKLLGFSANGGVEASGKLYYTVANSNKSMVIYNNPNVNTDGGLKGVSDEDYVTPNMNKTSSESTLEAVSTDYGKYFYRISEDQTGNMVDASPAKPFTPIVVADVDAAYATGKYFMEADNSGANWLWDNTPVAKIYACVLPSKVYYLGADKKSVMAKDIASLNDLKSISEPTGDDAIKTVTKDGSFFMGTDGKYYASQAAANVGIPDEKGNVRVYNEKTTPATTKLYIKGRCLYRFPVNANDYDYANFKDAYNKRNHIYALTVSGIAAIGDNYDPTDPTDPNVPKPTKKQNPNEPDVDKNQPIAKSTIYAAVKGKVANWTVVKNSVTLGK